MSRIFFWDYTMIDLDNGVSPTLRQAIIWSNAGLLLKRLLAKKFSEIVIQIKHIPWTKLYLNVVCKMVAILSRLGYIQQCQLTIFIVRENVFCNYVLIPVGGLLIRGGLFIPISICCIISLSGGRYFRYHANYQYIEISSIFHITHSKQIMTELIT